MRRCSPLTAGFITGSAASAALIAYDACADGRLTSLPHIGTCHCWIVSLAGLVVGTLFAGLTILVHAFLRPLIHAIVRTVRIPPTTGEIAARLGRELRAFLTPQPLARCCASRAPPIAA